MIGGGVTSVVHASTGVALPPSQHEWFRTVPALFAEMRSASARTDVLKEVAFDPALGYPTAVSLDPVAGMADDEVAYHTRNVTRKP